MKRFMLKKNRAIRSLVRKFFQYLILNQTVFFQGNSSQVILRHVPSPSALKCHQALWVDV